MISPTGEGIRSDRAGDGHYGARRGAKTHKGVDYICIPEQPIKAPISGRIVREARPYATGDYSGVVIQNKHYAIKMFYLDPVRDLIGEDVEQGAVIGTAQDISKRYAGQGMTPHIHLEIDHVNPEIFVC
jgi:murein DD-endopeptidase MepM/ murein hydrolase activator NlpD